jgi:hypothetical protein
MRGRPGRLHGSRGLYNAIKLATASGRAKGHHEGVEAVAVRDEQGRRKRGLVGWGWGGWDGRGVGKETPAKAGVRPVDLCLQLADICYGRIAVAPAVAAGVVALTWAAAVTQLSLF